MFMTMICKCLDYYVLFVSCHTFVHDSDVFLKNEYQEYDEAFIEWKGNTGYIHDAYKYKY